MTAPRIVPRHEWGARAPKRAPKIIRPWNRRGVVAHHNGPNMRIDTTLPHDDLVDVDRGRVRAIQRFHQGTLGWSDTAYSWFIGQSGTLFEGRGIDWDQFANGEDQVGPNDGTDREWYTVMFLIGWDPATGVEEQPTAAALATFRWLINDLRSKGAGHQVRPHSDFKHKHCPGDTVRELCRSYDMTQIDEEDDDYMRLRDRHAEAKRLFQTRLEDGPLTSDLIAELQDALNGAGFNAGIVDGDPGPVTRGAWHRWEIVLNPNNANEIPGYKSWPTFWDRLFSGQFRPAAGERAEIEALTAAQAELEKQLARREKFISDATVMAAELHEHLDEAQ